MLFRTQFLLARRCNFAEQEHEIKTLFGRKVAIDASMSIYQFLIAVRQKDGEMLQNDAGETTRYVCGALSNLPFPDATP